MVREARLSFDHDEHPQRHLADADWIRHQEFHRFTDEDESPRERTVRRRGLRPVDPRVADVDRGDLPRRSDPTSKNQPDFVKHLAAADWPTRRGNPGTHRPRNP